MLNSILQIRQQTHIRQQKTASEITTSNIFRNSTSPDLTKIKRLEKDTLNISFKGTDLVSSAPDLCKNIFPYCRHKTYFFRNIKTLDFIKDYALKTFPQGTPVAVFGCSTGEEPYSLATMFMQHNRDKKYPITGYDLISKIINIAKTGLFRNDYKAYEGFLTDGSKVTDFNSPYKTAFWEYFEQIPSEISGLITDNVIKKASRDILTETDPTKIKELKKILMFSHVPCSERHGTFVYPKPGVFDEIVDFEVGDIHDLNNQLKLPKNTGVIMFKNAWYQLTGFNFQIPASNVVLDDVSQVLDKIKKSLADNGILVVGQFKNDHLFDSSQATRHIVQNGEKIEICDSTPFHKLLRKKGFKPVFYEVIHYKGKEVENGVYLPSVWRKGK